jgi:hypothetical protein
VAACFWKASVVFATALFICGIPAIFRHQATLRCFPDRLKPVPRAIAFFRCAAIEVFLAVLVTPPSYLVTMICAAFIFVVSRPLPGSHPIIFGISMLVLFAAYALAYELLRRLTWPSPRSGTRLGR